MNKIKRNLKREAAASQQGGFTMAELLLVMAFMGFLAIIAIPLVSDLRTSSESGGSSGGGAIAFALLAAVIVLGAGAAIIAKITKAKKKLDADLKKEVSAT